MAGKKKTKAPRKRERKRKREKPGLIGRARRYVLSAVLRVFWFVAWRLGLAAALVLAAATGFYYIQLPAVEHLFDDRGSGSVTMLDRHGNVFAWRGEQYGGELSASEVSPHLVHAVIAAEDRRYYRHFGVDPLGIARAMVANIRAGRLVQGGSTLTQGEAVSSILIDNIVFSMG